MMRNLLHYQRRNRKRRKRLRILVAHSHQSPRPCYPRRKATLIVVTVTRGVSLWMLPFKGLSPSEYTPGDMSIHSRRQNLHRHFTVHNFVDSSRQDSAIFVTVHIIIFCRSVFCPPFHRPPSLLNAHRIATISRLLSCFHQPTASFIFRTKLSSSTIQHQRGISERTKAARVALHLAIVAQLFGINAITCIFP
jgi:hypothetical protein